MSKFLSVECKCGNQQVLFSHSSSVVKCSECSEPLVHPAGGTAIVHGKVVKEYD
ncbi:30S ribosomal protein S27e [Candidatus Micrarchaeota archaeon]|nr:30S ribosomal protein S27e [Candidatus Micrarchaeota archaeon]